MLAKALRHPFAHMFIMAFYNCHQLCPERERQRESETADGRVSGETGGHCHPSGALFADTTKRKKRRE